MFVFILIYFIPIVFFIHANISKKPTPNVIWFFVGLFYILINGLRSEIGTDWEAYLKHYNVIEGAPLLVGLVTSDPGYAFVNWLSSIFNGQIYLVNIICASIYIIGLVSFCKKQANPWLAFLIAQPILTIMVGMTYSRQSAAIGFELLALSALYRGANRAFIVYIIIGALFHKTLLFFLPFITLVGNKNKFLTIVSISLVSLGLVFVLIADQYESMIELYVDQQLSSDGALYRLLLNIFPAFLLLFFGSKNLSSNFDIFFWKILAILALLCFPLLSVASTATDRIALYLNVLQIVVYSNLKSFITNDLVYNVVIIFVIIFYFIFLFYWLIFGTYTDYYVPYKMFPFN